MCKHITFVIFEIEYIFINRREVILFCSRLIRKMENLIYNVHIVYNANN